MIQHLRIEAFELAGGWRSLVRALVCARGLSVHGVCGSLEDQLLGLLADAGGPPSNIVRRVRSGIHNCSTGNRLGAAA